jgi:hypothetical protein
MFLFIAQTIRCDRSEGAPSKVKEECVSELKSVGQFRAGSGGRYLCYTFSVLKGVKFAVGYTDSPELDQAILAGEVDGRAHNGQSLLTNPELVDQSNFSTRIVEWRPARENIRNYGNLPELETFANSQKRPGVCTVHDAGNVKVAGSPFILPPNTPGKGQGRVKDIW